jgi:hypothetical protein
MNIHTTPSLAGASMCVALTEPTALYRTDIDAIDLALGCVYFEAATAKIKVILLRSFDHAASFTYITDLVTGDDALALGFSVPQLNAANLFNYTDANDNHHLLLFVSPAAVGAQGFQGYAGCILFEIDPVTSSVRRNSSSTALLALQRFVMSNNFFSGACSNGPFIAAGHYIAYLYLVGATPSFTIIPTTPSSLPIPFCPTAYQLRPGEVLSACANVAIAGAIVGTSCSLTCDDLYLPSPPGELEVVCHPESRVWVPQSERICVLREMETVSATPSASPSPSDESNAATRNGGSPLLLMFFIALILVFIA